MKFEKLYTRNEVCELLGISLATLNSWMQAGIISYIKPIKVVRFKESEIKRILKGKK